MPLAVVLISLFALSSGVAASSPPATTLALADYPHIAGTASSLLGTIRFGLGAVAAPLVGVAGAHSILPLGIVATVAVAIAIAVLPRTGVAQRPDQHITGGVTSTAASQRVTT